MPNLNGTWNLIRISEGATSTLPWSTARISVNNSTNKVTVTPAGGTAVTLDAALTTDSFSIAIPASGLFGTGKLRDTALFGYIGNVTSTSTDYHPFIAFPETLAAGVTYTLKRQPCRGSGFLTEGNTTVSTDGASWTIPATETLIFNLTNTNGVLTATCTPTGSNYTYTLKATIGCSGKTVVFGIVTKKDGKLTTDDADTFVAISSQPHAYV